MNRNVHGNQFIKVNHSAYICVYKYEYIQIPNPLKLLGGPHFEIEGPAGAYNLWEHEILDYSPSRLLTRT